MLLYLGFIWLQWFLAGDAEGRKKHIPAAALSSYFVAELSLIVIFLASSLDYKGAVLLLVMTALHLALGRLRLGMNEKSPIQWAIRVNELLWILAAAGCVAFVKKDAISEMLYLALAVLAGAAALTGIRENLLKDRIRIAEEALYIVKSAAVVMAVVYAYAEPYRAHWRLLTGAALALAFYVLRHFLYRRHGRSEAEPPLGPVMRVIEYLMFAGAVGFVAFSSKDSVSNALCLVLAALAAAVGFVRSGEIFAGKTPPWEQVLYGVKFTALAMAVVYGHTEWFASTYVISLVCMLTALGCVVAGFISRPRPCGYTAWR